MTDNPEPLVTSYDDVPYESHPFAQSHPDRLATMARLFGMDPAPVTGCRVLELGCASGGNIIPMAVNTPDSSYVGVDLSGKQIEDGKAHVANLGLDNVELRQNSITDVDESWGKFDYILCHGVFSWVPPEVQDSIIGICAENLNPQGVAYISYNVYPGWHMREMIRHMMLYHCEQFSDPKQKVQQARALLDFLANSVPTKDNHYGLLLKSELDLLRKCRDSYLYHEHLEDDNRPMYFHQFMERAGTRGLQYLSEAEFSTMMTSGFKKEVADTLKRISTNIIKTEQYMDFVRNRLFRQTLLCHKDVQLKRNLTWEDVPKFLIASSAAPENNHQVELSSGKRESFKTNQGVGIQVSRPIVKAALLVLKETWPRALPFDEVFEKSLERLEKKPEDEAGKKQVRANLASDILQGYTARMVELHTWQPEFVTEVSEKPVAAVAAREYANNGNITVNQRHESVAMDAVTQNLLPLLDGEHDRQQLFEAIKEAWTEGRLILKRNDQPIEDEEQAMITLEKALDQSLNGMANKAVLVA